VVERETAFYRLQVGTLTSTTDSTLEVKKKEGANPMRNRKRIWKSKRFQKGKNRKG